LLDVCRKCGVKGFISASTMTVYRQSANLLLTDEMPTRPVLPRDVVEASTGDYGLVFHRLYALGTTILRLPNVYVPRDPNGKYRSATSNLIRQVATGTPPGQSKGQSTRDQHRRAAILIWTILICPVPFVRGVT
jgi:nucleoside-diphosphate-sugar epimerase